MTITHTKNTRRECVGFSDELGHCVRLVNYKNKTIDCDKCRFYQAVDDKDKYWREVDKICTAYSSPF